MGTSSKPMRTAIVIYQGKSESVPPQIALNYREKNEKPEHILRCPDYFKTGCPALLKVVTGTPPYYALKQHENHKGCEYEHDNPTFTGNIKEHTSDKLPVLMVKDSDMFSPKKKRNPNAYTTPVSTSPVRKRRGRSTKEYINTVYEFHQFLHESNKALIENVISKLKKFNLLYEQSDFNSLLKKQSNDIILVQGFLDKRDIQLLQNKGYVYLYAKHAKHLDIKTRIMLVHNGNGQEKFKDHLKHLLEWIASRKAENRKLTTVKGRVVNRYTESNTIVFHVQDIDIKYREKEWNTLVPIENPNRNRYKIKTDSNENYTTKEINSNVTPEKGKEEIKEVSTNNIKEMSVINNSETKTENNSLKDDSRKKKDSNKITNNKPRSLFMKIKSFLFPSKK